MIELPDRFKLDVIDSGYNFTSLYPLVVIDGISPHIAAFQEDKVDSDNQKDCDLRISNIRESIDINNRHFKTSNVNITFRNPDFKDGMSFTDYIIDKDIINKEVSIYYTSATYTLEDSLLVYAGTVKSLSHDSSKVAMVVEDRTLDKLDKKVPYAKVVSKNRAYRTKDINASIPMVYGYVEKAPTLILTDNSDADSEIKNFVIADDVIDSDRNIVLNTFIGGDEINDGISTGTNPLYIYNGDYYNVLEEFNNSVIGDVEDVEDWQWGNTTQYLLSDPGKIEIPRVFQGVFPLNPPAFNELQCVKLRTPMSLVNMSNPEIGYSLDDSGENIIYNLEASILNPQLAVDNNLALMQDIYTVPNAQEIDPYSPPSYAQIPDPDSSELDIIGDYTIIPWFQPHREAPWVHGVFNRLENDEFYPGYYQYEVHSWLTRNMNVLNAGIDLSIEEPNVVYIEMPNASRVLNMAKAKMVTRLINLYGYTYEEAIALNIFESNPQDPYGNRMNSFVNICPNHISGWGSKIETPDGDASEYWAVEDSAGSIMTDPINFLGNQPRNTPGYEILQSGSTWATNTDFQSVKYPQATFYRFTLAQEFRKPEGEEPGLGASFFCVSQLTDAMPDGFGVGGYCNTTGDDGTYPPGADGYDPQENAIYYDIFPTDDSPASALFNDSLDAQYAPIDLVWKGHPGQYSWQCRLIYRTAWNGRTIGEHELDVHGFSNITSDKEYFGGWALHSIDGFSVKEDEMYTDTNKSWAIWIKGNSISQTGGDLGQLNDDPADNPENDDFFPEVTIPLNTKLSIPKGTIIPCKHKVQKGDGNTNVRYTGQDFVISQAQVLDRDTITLHDGHPDFYTEDGVNPILDQRLNLAFPLRELEIENEIKTDSFFQGKFEINFDTEATSNIGTAKFIAAIGAVDTKNSEVEDDAEFDWQTLDQSRNELVSKTLSECISLGNITFSTAPGDNGQDGNLFPGGENSFLDLRIPQFHTTDNYNALNLSLRVDNENVSDQLDDEVAVFDMNIYNASIVHYTQFEKALESDFYMSVEGRVNLTVENNNQFFKYTGNSLSSSHDPITRPTDIIFHILEKELNVIDNMDYDSIAKARSQIIPSTPGFSFSVKEEMDAKALFQEMSKSSNIIPKFNNNSKFGFVALNSSYGLSDVNMTIKNKDIISYSFSRTPISEINTLVNVKYKYDYASDEYTRQTGYIDGYDCFGNGDHQSRLDEGFDGYSYESLGIEREDKVLEFESKYITDKNAAEQLRNFLYLWHCNQHTRFDLRLPLKYCMLEVGDIVNFDELIDGHKAYGEDYTSGVVLRNMQEIYPYFLIESISKREKDIQVKVIQLHSLSKPFTCQMGSIQRLFGVGEDVTDLDANSSADISIDNYNILEDFLLGFEKYFTAEQRRVSDLTGNGYITDEDLISLIGGVIPNTSDITGGDINDDSLLNIVDIVSLVNHVLGTTTLTEGSLAAADLNADGTINVVDIIALVNLILDQ